nr:MAG: putative glycoprotein 3 [Jingmen shrew arterivirus 1]
MLDRAGYTQRGGGWRGVCIKVPSLPPFLGHIKTILLLSACFGFRSCNAGCVPCTLNLQMLTAKNIELKSMTRADLSALDMSVNGTLFIQYNYTWVSPGGVMLGLANCFAYALLKWEEGKAAKLVNFGNKLGVCSTLGPDDVEGMDLGYYEFKGFFFSHFSPRVMQWSVVIVCIFAYFYAVIL